MAEKSSRAPSQRRPVSIVLIVIAVVVTFFLMRKRDRPTVATEDKIQIESISEIERLGGSVKRGPSGWLAVALPEATDADLDRVVQLERLASLNLNGSSITDEGLRQLKNLGDLEVLDLRNTPITDDGLEHLQAFPKLEHLNLSGTQITGAGLAHLGSLTHLRVLMLSENRIDDEALSQLSSLGRIELLYLDGPPQNDLVSVGQYGQISDVGLAALPRTHETEDPQRAAQPRYRGGRRETQSRLAELQCSVLRSTWESPVNSTSY